MCRIPEHFLSKLIDWREFELFVADLYRDSEEVLVRHNVTELGKSNAKRQIDVLVEQKTKLHKFKILVECKFWKNKIDRPVIDILAAAIDDLSANKGVIFTTVGFEEGAVEYAKSENIDLFIVRNVMDEEWGAPGRHIWFYLQFFNGKITEIQLTGLKFASVTGIVPQGLKFSLDFTNNNDNLDEEQQLFDYQHKRGPHLAILLRNIRNQVLKTLTDQFNTLLGPVDGKPLYAVEIPITLNLENFPFKCFHNPDGLIFFSGANLKLLVTIEQSKHQWDRADTTEFVFMVENYITNHKNFAFKSKEDGKTYVSEPIQKAPSIDKSDVLENGSIMKVMLDYFVGFNLPQNHTIHQGNPMTVNVQ